MTKNNQSRRHSSLKTVWFNDVLNDPKAKEDLEKTLRNSVVAFSKLLDILEDQKRTLNSGEVNEDYSDNSWAYKQAHKNGYRQHLQETIDLLQFIKG